VLHVDESAVKPSAGYDLDNRWIGESHVAYDSQTAVAHDLFDLIRFHDSLPFRPAAAQSRNLGRNLEYLKLNRV
jgi:hypothetical protein